VDEVNNLVIRHRKRVIDPSHANPSYVNRILEPKVISLLGVFCLHAQGMNKRDYIAIFPEEHRLEHYGEDYASDIPADAAECERGGICMTLPIANLNEAWISSEADDEHDQLYRKVDKRRSSNRSHDGPVG
jgi:hypothetical protein